MGVTVVSNASLQGIQGKSSGTDAAADSSGSGDFAALLTQLSAPQGLGLQFPSLASLSIQDGDADAALATETDAETPEDLSALLASTGFLQNFLAAARPPLADKEAATQQNTDDGKGQEAIAGLLGQVDLSASRNTAPAPLDEGEGTDAISSLIGNPLQSESANLAVELKSNTGNDNSFANTLASQAAMTQPARHQDAGPVAAEVRTPVQNSGWGQDFGEKIVWLAKSDQQVAQLNLNPPQLGPMHITLNLNGDQASALFISPHAEVRQAIEDAMPQLREMLSGAGINLGQANVGTQLPQQNTGTQPQFSGSSPSGVDNAILRADNGQETTPPVATVRSGRGMVDLFA